MVHAVRAAVNRATARFILRSGSAASMGSAPAPLSPRHFLIGSAAIKSARNSPENNALNFSNRLKSANCSAHFSHVLRSKNHHSSVTHHGSRFSTHPPLLTNHALLIATQILDINLTSSEQTRKHFLIGTKSRISALTPRLHNRPYEFLIATDRIQKIANLMKTKEKRFSNRNNKTHFRSPASTRFSLRRGIMYSAQPMLDLGYVREHLDVIEKMAQNRGLALDLAPFRQLDTDRRMVITSAERLKAERNKASEEIARMKKSGADASSLLALMKQVSDQIKRDDETITVLDSQLQQFLLTVPNIPHSSVPVGRSAADNVEVRRWGAPPQFDFKPKAHWELGEGAGILDFDAAIKIAGSRFAVYKGLGARLERALANFFLDVHTREHGYTEILPPSW